jgi:general secretion pathway protein C
MVAGTFCGCILLFGEGFRSLRRAKVGGPSKATESHPLAAPPQPPSVREIGVRVLARNVFDSQTGPLPWDEAERPALVADGDGDVGATQADAPRPCEGSEVRLVASVVNAEHPEHSFAAVRKDEKTQLLGVGGRLGEMTLLALRPTFAYVQAGSAAPCTLPVYLPASQRASPAPEQKVNPVDARAPKPKAKPLFSEQELVAAVRSLGGGRYAVSKALFVRALGNPTGAARGARLRPVDRYGRTVGWELARLRKESVLAHMGLQKGDLLRSVNGHELADAADLLVALRMLRQADSVTLGIMRGNVVQHLQYTLD